MEAATGPVPLSVLTRGEVSDEAVDYARQRVGHLVKLVEEPILSARVKLQMAAAPDRARPAIAQALLDINGRMVRAHVTIVGCNFRIMAVSSAFVGVRGWPGCAPR